MTNQIIVTGAGGWLATEFVEGLVDKPREFNSLLLLGRNTATRVFSGGLQRKQSDFFKTEIDFKIEGLVHLAFLTMGRIEESGAENYKRENLRITNKAAELIRKSKPKWVVTVSSGAAELYMNEDENSPLHIYGACKAYEEDQISKACEDVGATFVCGRLWGALGSHMPVNTKYAVSDFIVSALTHHKIQINNQKIVFRRYVNAGDFMQILHRSAVSGISGTLDSGGELLTLTDLAMMISEEIGSVEVLIPTSTGEVDKKYIPSNPQYENRAFKLGIRVNEFSTTLRATIESHQNSLGLDLLK